MRSTLLRLVAVLGLFLAGAGLSAEKVADLPVPTTYVNDFAHVLSPETARKIEDISTQVHQKAAAELFVVTIKQLEDGQSIEDFSQALVEKWKIGKAGQDRSALMLLVLDPHGLRIETGYGLEGEFNDAKVGAILDEAKPLAKAGNYDAAMLTEENALASAIAADKGVTLDQTVHTYHRQAAPPQQLTGGQVVLGIGFVLVLLYLVATGRLGWAWMLLSMFSGGGGGGGGGRNDDEGGGGGFGGVGGGGSGGGGASRDF